MNLTSLWAFASAFVWLFTVALAIFHLIVWQIGLLPPLTGDYKSVVQTVVVLSTPGACYLWGFFTHWYLAEREDRVRRQGAFEGVGSTMLRAASTAARQPPPATRTSSTQVRKSASDPKVSGSGGSALH